MIDKFLKIFYNWWWQKHPPEQVKYYKTQEYEKAKLIMTDEGIKMQIRGEKYPFPGFPRGHILTNPHFHTNFSILKHRIKNEIFNYAWEELEKGEKYYLEIVQEIKKRFFGEIYKVMKKSKFDMLPQEKMCVAVRELWRAMTELEKEYPETYKLKEILCFILQEDDGYRFRIQWLTNYFNPNSFWHKFFRKDNVKQFEIAWQQLENAEVLDDMKGRVRLWRRILLFILQDYGAKDYFDLLCKTMNWNKFKMSKADKYFCRGKWFKCDYKIYDY